MTQIARYFCDYCNPSQQVRNETMEHSTGYVEVERDTEASDWAVVEGGFDICPVCQVDPSNQNPAADAVKRSAPVHVAKPHESGWPAVKSPFGEAGAKDG